MSRLEIKMPEFYPFKHEMKIRNTDIAKDNHVSFASILDIVFEAHLRFFKFLGYEVTNVHGLHLLFSDAIVLYRGELLEDDVVKIEVTANGFFEKGCDIDSIINNLFVKYEEIKGDTEYITYKIKKRVEEDRIFLNRINGEGQHPLNIMGKVSYLKHYVIPEQNNGKEYYVYCINSFI